MSKLEFIDLKTQYAALKDRIAERMQRVLDHGQYIMGPEVRELEVALEQRTGARHCITVASGRSRRSPCRLIQPTWRAGTPTTSAKSGTSRWTTAPAPTNPYSPIVTPQTSVQLAPSVAPRRTRVGRYSPLRTTAARGL